MGEHGIRPVGGRMTCVAFLCRHDVGRAFSAGKIAVVTTAANAHDIAVVYLWHRCESARAGVAVLAHATAGNVRVALADDARASVAAGTVARDAGVIKLNGRPVLSAAMTQITFQRGAHMLR